MKCPGCGYVTFDFVETCANCGAPTRAPGPSAVESEISEDLRGLRLDAGTAPAVRARENRPTRAGRRRGVPGRTTRKPCADDGAPPPLPDAELSGEISEQELDIGLLKLSPNACPAREREETFHLDDALFPPLAPDAFELASCGAEPVSAQLFADGEPAGPAGGGPIIDRDDEVPGRFWAPEAAGFGRRAVAVFVDQTLLAAVLGIFVAGAGLALAREGYAAERLLSGVALRAAAPPLAVLGALLSFAYYVFFHGATGQTPGKMLAGIEVRCRDGSTPDWGRSLGRWGAALLAVCCAGVGVAWAFFEPRRRGWADLLSNTVLAERFPRLCAVDNLGGRGYHAPAVQGRDSSAGRATD